MTKKPTVNYVSLVASLNTGNLEFAQELIKQDLMLEAVINDNTIQSLINVYYHDILNECSEYLKFIQLVKTAFYASDKMRHVLNDNHCVDWVPNNSFAEYGV